MLVFHREPREPVLSGRLLLGKREERNIHIWINCNMVRRGMMEIVFVEPPAVTKSEQQIGMNQANCLIPSGAAENFLMPGVVDDETKLSKHKREKSGFAELRPWIVKSCDQQENAHEHCEVEKHLPAVIRRLLHQ